MAYPAFKKAEILSKRKRNDEAIAALRAAPIAREVETYPGLAGEVAYFGGYLCRKQGLRAPRDGLDLIPDDFTTRIDDKSVGKAIIENERA